jgi:hypothetical protein
MSWLIRDGSHLTCVDPPRLLTSVKVAVDWANLIYPLRLRKIKVVPIKYLENIKQFF